MPVQLGEDKDGCYARWGTQGHKYRYECGNKESRERAQRRAAIQGRAVEASKEEYDQDGRRTAPNNK